jgi:hypothetical protein
VCSANTRIQTRRRGKVYECGTHRQRGRAICANDITVKQPAFDDALRVALREVRIPNSSKRRCLAPWPDFDAIRRRSWIAAVSSRTS